MWKLGRQQIVIAITCVCWSIHQFTLQIVVGHFVGTGPGWGDRYPGRNHTLRALGGCQCIGKTDTQIIAVSIVELTKGPWEDRSPINTEIEGEGDRKCGWWGH